MPIVDELIAILGYKITGEDEARRFEQRIDNLNKGVNKFATNVGKLAGAASLAMAGAMGTLGRSVVKTSAQFEGYQATLETIEGSSERAKRSLSWIAEFGKTTPYDVAQVTESFVALKAYGIDPIADDALRTLGDTSSAMGKPLKQAVEAFADAATGEFERLKEFGIKAKTQGDNVTFSWTKNGEELTKTVKKGSNEIRAFLLENMGDRFSGAMDRQSRTWDGMMSNLGDTWVDFKRRIGDAGFFSNVSGHLQTLLNFLNRLDSEGKLDEWAENISNALSKMSDFFVIVAERIATNIAFISENFDALQGPLSTVSLLLLGLMVRAFPIVSIFAALVLVLDDFLAYLQGGESYIGDFIDWLKDLTGVSTETAEKLAMMVGVTAAFVLLAGPVKTLGMAFKILASGIKSATLAAGAKSLGGIASKLLGLVTTTSGVASSVVGGSVLGLYANGKAVERQNEIARTNTPEGTAVRVRREDQAMNAPFSQGGATSYPNATAQAIDPQQAAKIMEMIRKNQSLTEKIAGDRGIEATVNDSRQDNRAFPITNNVTVNQTVTEATNAPSQVADATANATANALPASRAQSEGEPSF